MSFSSPQISQVRLWTMPIRCGVFLVKTQFAGRWWRRDGAALTIRQRGTGEGGDPGTPTHLDGELVHFRRWFGGLPHSDQWWLLCLLWEWAVDATAWAWTFSYVPQWEPIHWKSKFHSAPSTSRATLEIPQPNIQARSLFRRMELASPWGVRHSRPGWKKDQMRRWKSETGTRNKGISFEGRKLKVQAKRQLHSTHTIKWPNPTSQSAGALFRIRIEPS